MIRSYYTELFAHKTIRIAYRTILITMIHNNWINHKFFISIWILNRLIKFDHMYFFYHSILSKVIFWYAIFTTFANVIFRFSLPFFFPSIQINLLFLIGAIIVFVVIKQFQTTIPPLLICIFISEFLISNPILYFHSYHVFPLI